MNELTTQGAAQLARAGTTARETTAGAVVDAHLARIADINPDINAVTATLADRPARGRGRRPGGRRRPALGPLAGVPFSVKENVDVAGSATTWGVQPWPDKSPRPMRRRGAASRSGRHPFRPHESAGLRVPMGHRQRSGRPDPQSLGRDTYCGRIIRRRGRRAGCRHDAARPG